LIATTGAAHPSSGHGSLTAAKNPSVLNKSTSRTTIEKAIRKNHRASEGSLRLQTIPGVGVIIASAITATIGDIKAFKSGRYLAAWIGLVPRQSGSGGKVYMGKISGALFTEHAAVVG